jgi:hypothetical protein
MSNNNQWFVEEISIAEKTLYTAARSIGDKTIFQGGYWETRAEAEKVVERLEMESFKEKLP